MFKTFKVRIENGCQETFHEFTDSTFAIGFAKGYCQCLANSGIHITKSIITCVQGYVWLSKYGDIRVSVLDSNGELLKQ